MTSIKGRLKGFLFILGLLLSGWAIIFLIGYVILRSILSFMTTEDTD